MTLDIKEKRIQSHSFIAFLENSRTVCIFFLQKQCSENKQEKNGLILLATITSYMTWLAILGILIFEDLCKCHIFHKHFP